MFSDYDKHNPNQEENYKKGELNAFLYLTQVTSSDWFVMVHVHLFVVIGQLTLRTVLEVLQVSHLKNTLRTNLDSKTLLFVGFVPQTGQAMQNNTTLDTWNVQL